MSKKGPKPSLIGSGAGSVKIIQSLGKRKCKRCGAAISKGSDCAEVSKPGTMGHKTYCIACFGDVLDKTKMDLEALVKQVANL
jgi:hypothetical protein